MKMVLFLYTGLICFVPVHCLAYTSLITSTTFDGVTADVNTVAVSIIGIFITIAGVTMIIRGMLGK